MLVRCKRTTDLCLQFFILLLVIYFQLDVFIIILFEKYYLQKQSHNQSILLKFIWPYIGLQKCLFVIIDSKHQ